MIKKNSALLYILISILASSFLIGCSEDTPTDPPPVEPIIWQQNETFWGDRRIMLNSDSTGESLTIAGLTLMSRFGPGELVPNRINVVSGDHTLNGQPAIGGVAMMYRSGVNFHTLNYHALDRADCSGGGAGYPFVRSIDIADLSEFFTEDSSIIGNRYERQLGDFNDKDQFLVVAQNRDPEYGLSTGLCLISLNTTDTDNGFNSLCRDLTPEALVIDLDYSHSAFVNMIESVNSNFFVGLTTSARTFLRIDPDGIVETCQGITTSVDDLFEYDGALWAYSIEARSLFRSEDTGFNWSLVSEGIPGFSNKFFELDDKLCFFMGSQLAWINFEESYVYEVDNTGLENVSITSVQVFDDQVWLTTLSGLFCKDISGFFELDGDKSDESQRLSLAGPIPPFSHGAEDSGRQLLGLE